MLSVSIVIAIVVDAPTTRLVSDVRSTSLTRTPPSHVPFLLPSSRTRTPFGPSEIRTCSRDTAGSVSRMSAAWPVPITNVGESMVAFRPRSGP